MCCYRYDDTGVRGTRDRRGRFVCECREVRGTEDRRHDGYQWFRGGRRSCGCGRRREQQFRCECREVN